MDLLRGFRERLTTLWERERDDDTLPSSSVPASSLFTDPPRQVNDSLYELYKPEGTPSMQIVFFHGLKFGVSSESHMWTTWQSGDRTCIWPQKWLAEEFPSAQIFLVSYDGSVRNNFQYSPDIYIITENLTSDFLQGDIGVNPNCPVILVGHCCGGIVIKELCLRVNKMLSLNSFKSERAKLKNFLYNIKGIFYYSTPHHGVSTLNNESIVQNNPLLTYFQTMSKDAKRLNQEFGQLHKVHAKWRIHGVGTNIPTNLGRLVNIEIGSEVSGRDGDSYNVIPGVDHYDICKPQDKNTRSYYALTNLVKTIASDPEVVHLCHDLQDFCPGLENLVQAVEEKLKNKKVVGIVGMGGVGKTTLAKKLFNNISQEYEYTCFVDNVKGIQSNKLKRELLDEFHCNGVGVKSNQIDWSHLKGKKTLLVMDDVDSVNQLNCLPASLAAFGNGSHLIITSRFRNILDESKYYADSEIYDVDHLGEADAKKLFCYHAFGSENIPSNLVENVERIVWKCQGLPLTLEVLGCCLRGKDSHSDPEIWKETIDSLEQAEAIQGGDEDKVWARLRISYDKKLSREEQEMFIDAATFFFGQPVEEALGAWGTAYGNPHLRWKNLLNTCLVKVKVRKGFGREIKLEPVHEVWVHEHLRDLAKKISKADVSSMRDAMAKMNSKADLSSMRDAIYPTTDTDTRHVLGLSKNGLRLLRNGQSNDWLQLDLPDKMENLKYLEVEGSLTGLGNKFPTKLSLLRWQGQDSADLLPINLEKLSDLAILELSSLKVLEEFSEALGSLKNLHTLSLSHLGGIHHLPTNFGTLSRLKRLKLKDLSIRTLPDSFADLRALEYLQCDCLGLSELPENFGELSALRSLTMYAKSLEKLPDSFGRLSALEKLDLWGCEQLKSLPENFGELLALRILHIRGTRLEKLPDNFGHLSALQDLELSGRVQLHRLPDDFGQLKALKKLNISGAGQLKVLPDNFGGLSALEKLDLSDCEQLQRLPDDFGQLKALKKLNIIRAGQLKVLPGNFRQLVALKELYLYGEVALEVLDHRETLGNFSSLEVLWILCCPTLETLPESVGHSSSLRKVVLVNCKRIKNLPDSLGKPCLPQLAIPQQDSPVEGHAPKITATEGVRLTVMRCPLLDASALQSLGWVKSKDGEDIYQRRSESD